MMKKIMAWFAKISSRSQGRAAHVEKMLEMLAMTSDQEISCDDVHDLIDQFTEMVSTDQDAAQLMPLVQLHLELCPDCREEHEALLQALAFDRQGE
jgi:hypothetical protein